MKRYLGTIRIGNVTTGEIVLHHGVEVVRKMSASNQMFIASKNSRGMEYVMISMIHLFVNLTWEIAAPMRFSLIRVTDECNVGGLCDRFLSMFRSEFLTETYVSAEGSKKLHLYYNLANITKKFVESLKYPFSHVRLES